MIPKEKLERARELSEHFDRPECRQELIELIHSCLTKNKKHLMMISTRKPKAKHCMLCKKMMLLADSENGWCNKLKMQVETKDICRQPPTS